MQITLKNISFQYNSRTQPLYNGLNHVIEPGKITALTGPSGCGKSTLLYLCGLLLKPTNGEIYFNSLNITSINDTQRAVLRAQQIGFVFQDAALNPYRPIIDSVIEPALYAGKTRTEAYQNAKKLLEYAEVSYRISHRPNEISGGQAQRVAFARALINNPAIILADEPTGNLDEQNSKKLLTLLKEQADTGKTVLIVTHDNLVTEYADTVWEVGKNES